MVPKAPPSVFPAPKFGVPNVFVPPSGFVPNVFVPPSVLVPNAGAVVPKVGADVLAPKPVPPNVFVPKPAPNPVSQKQYATT